ncbi:MAG: DUF1415 domain-containing protein [Chitinophagaceae bacterium]
MPTAEQVIEQTSKWIKDVVVGCNFCPFAAREVKRNSIHYQVETATTLAACLQSFLNECKRLDAETIETTLLILPDAFPVFKDYLQLVDMAERLLKQEGYEGVYQVADFHPQYAFAGAPANDAANYTNRSPYPMLHLLREESVEKALQHHPDPDAIPQRNIDFARAKGLAYMQLLRNACMEQE